MTTVIDLPSAHDLEKLNYAQRFYKLCQNNPVWASASLSVALLLFLYAVRSYSILELLKVMVV